MSIPFAVSLPTARYTLSVSLSPRRSVRNSALSSASEEATVIFGEYALAPPLAHDARSIIGIHAAASIRDKNFFI